MFCAVAGVKLMGEVAAVAWGVAGHLGAMVAKVLETEVSAIPVAQ
jgi:hypothetical protein